MNWRSHALIGAVFAGFVFWVFGVRDVPTLALGVVFGALSALVPDLDHDSSKGRQLLDVGFVAFSFLTVYLGTCNPTLCLPAIPRLGSMLTIALAMIGAYFIIFRFFKPRHRGITHTLVACFGFGVLIWVVGNQTLAIAAFVGYLSHLVADRHMKFI